MHSTGWIAEVDVAWDTARGAVDKIGKQHLWLATYMSQSIGKRIVEFSMHKKAELKQCVAAYRQALHEINRAKTAMRKSKQKYTRAVEDADQVLQTRDRVANDSRDKAEPDRFLGKVRVKLAKHLLAEVEGVLRPCLLYFRCSVN